MGGIVPTADLLAGAIVAAALAFGDDPVEAVLSKAPPKRRARSCAARALADELGLTAEAAARLLGVAKGTLENLARYATSAQDRAIGEARAAIRAAAPPAPTENLPAPRVVRAAPTIAHPLEGASPVLPALRGSRIAGAPAPPRADVRAAEIGPSPADVVGNRYERRFVTERREREPPMPWSQIAKQLGKSEDYLRRTYDLGHLAAVPTLSARDAASRPPTVLAGTIEAKVLALVDGSRFAVDIGRLLERDARGVGVVVSNLRRKGLVTPAESGPPRRTAAGAREMERLDAR